MTDTKGTEAASTNIDPTMRSVTVTRGFDGAGMIPEEALESIAQLVEERGDEIETKAFATLEAALQQAREERDALLEAQQSTDERLERAEATIERLRAALEEIANATEGYVGDDKLIARAALHEGSPE